MKIAIVGAGVSGLGAAWLLSREHEVVVYEAADYLGGHANTRDIEVEGRSVAVDTGFIVYNERNYPHLTKLFDAIGVATEASDMSFAVSLDKGAIEYEGSPRGLFAQPGNMVSPSHWRMLLDAKRFYETAPALLEAANDHDPTLDQVLRDGGYSQAFAERHLLPMAAAIWSSPLAEIGSFPARSFVRFFVNHALFEMTSRPQWRTVTGGSREYVRRLAAPFADRVRLKTPVIGLRRTPLGVWVRDALGNEERFDQLILATHGDQSLAILGDQATGPERQILRSFAYQPNRAVLHCDPTLLPRRRRVWASWNYLAERAAQTDGALCVSYWMNRLQNLPVRTPVVVTLNPTHEPDPEKVFAEIPYRHPQFDHAALRAQTALPEIQGQERTWFCGSYCGYGFHEDGLEAGFAVAAALGVEVPWADQVYPTSPAAQVARPLATALAAE